MKKLPYVLILLLVAVGIFFWKMRPASQPSSTTNTPVFNANTSDVNLSVFYVAIGDNGKTGKLIGCGDSLVAADSGTRVRVSSPATERVTTALQVLLTERESNVGESGLMNALAASRLSIESVMQKDETITVRLKGTVSLGGTCDTPRFKEQLIETAVQSSGYAIIEIFLNDKTLDEALSLKG